jgi:AraC family transcriptional regulator, transcriptional activator of pobA
LFRGQTISCYFRFGVLAARRQIRCGFSLKRREWWTALLNQLTEEFGNAYQGANVASRAILELLLVEAGRMCMPAMTTVSAAVRPELTAVFAILDDQFADAELRLTAIADQVDRSPAYLTDVMRRSTGRTVMQWLVERRIAEARWRLATTDEEISIIGERVGYPDPAHFPRVFRSITGISPSGWRKEQGRH